MTGKVLDFTISLDRDQYEVLWRQAFAWMGDETGTTAEQSLGGYLREALDRQSAHWKSFEK
ncbi:MAG: hypothetical protein U0Y82_05385 [Thermoleophilia bacterium]